MKSTLKKCTCFLASVLAVCGGALCLPETAASANGERRYYDETIASTYAVESETISFATREETYVQLPYGVPYYSSTLSNACGPVAGGIVVGYYDKYFENLIPDYTAYYTATGKYRMPDSTYVPGMIQSLYTLMRTNVDDVGVSEADCLNGLESYVEGKGYTLEYTSLRSTSFEHTACKTALNAQEAILLFCDSVELVGITSGTTEDTIRVMQSTGSHVMVAMGYRQFKYFDANGNNFRTDTYLKVASGWDANPLGYVKLGDESWLDSAYAVDIY